MTREPVWVRSSPAVSKTGICDTGSRAFDGIDLFCLLAFILRMQKFLEFCGWDIWCCV